ncbi:putative rossmann-like alpha/beta/alpha sandwich protein [Helianthus annuus]|uniref:Universal stress protein A n=1 Tax=Helianthus annuus TaxID=4232 RepID=A0A9K3P2V8_HELAN|nr:putative universal stress protein A [Helianthus annuus]KAJ0611421.1 putative rossmann-like alpha/beta/alpha sandwich protein [Helianthus annuus]KAJ0622465.1 putative rossmann-like alpha/beta/alpha sandwich protein [Helianthus annuus]KAJ0626718.1 putative rossmann-like alpha/beta/alpha sandwich protein [Helianthus annuus]KAJ0783067.1 putative rossmann-like alpha/beta/alpha sandwich protein [Helianthus annuus]
MVKDRKVGIAMDFSKSSKSALQWAIDNLAGKGDTFYIIHIKSLSNLWETSGSSNLRSINYSFDSVGGVSCAGSYGVKTDIDVLNILDTGARQKEVSVFTMFVL